MSLYFVLFLTGVLSHRAYFHRGEHHMLVVRYLQAFFTVFIATSALLSVKNSQPLGQASLVTSSLAFSYFVGLYLSLVLDRIFLSPLRKFPGPVAASISNLWFAFQSRRADGHRKILAYHERYGDYVRIGSSDLSIANPKAVNAVYGLGSKCTKADWYDLTLPTVSMQTTRNRAEHDAQRRIWSAAFSDKALRGYEERMKSHQKALCARFRAGAGGSVNVTRAMNHYLFDVMGDLACGTSFNMMKTDEEHWAIELLNEGMEPLGWMLPTWLFRLLTAIPFASAGWWRFIAFCNQQLEERMNVSHHDIHRICVQN